MSCFGRVTKGDDLRSSFRSLIIGLGLSFRERRPAFLAHRAMKADIEMNKPADVSFDDEPEPCCGVLRRTMLLGLVCICVGENWPGGVPLCSYNKASFLSENGVCIYT